MNRHLKLVHQDTPAGHLLHNKARKLSP